jgi:hybrid polyketide synthase / nonribosomal peptide synthetase ACE1
MYRTKDRGRLLRNGWVSVKGRIGHDTLIKLRGVRIDLQDIENTILRSAPGGAIMNAVASVRSDGISKCIVAHVSFTTENNAPRTEDNKYTYLSCLLKNLPL